jgi:hypothetical protein
MTLALHRLCAISIATLVSFLAGCANLGAIQEFGKLSADSAGYTKLTDDYLAGPSNQKKYTLTSEADKRDELDRLSKERAKQGDQLGLYHITRRELHEGALRLGGRPSNLIRQGEPHRFSRRPVCLSQTGVV